MYYDIKACGARMKWLRKTAGFTQERLSYQLNISSSYLRKMEAGICSGSIELLVEIAELFGVSLDYLILGKLTSDMAKAQLRSAIETLTEIEKTL